MCVCDDCVYEIKYIRNMHESMKTAHNTHKLQQSLDAYRAALKFGGGDGSCVVAIIWHERM